MAAIEEIPQIEDLNEDEVVDESTPAAGGAAGARKPSRNEKKSRAAMAKLGMKPVPDIYRVTLKQSKGFLCVVADPEVFKAVGSDTYVILGDTAFEDPSLNRAAKAAKSVEETTKTQAAPAATSTVSTPAASEDDVDLQGLSPVDVDIVMKESKASKAKVVEALKRTGDVVQAVLELSS
eukprot:gene14376-16964_t